MLGTSRLPNDRMSSQHALILDSICPTNSTIFFPRQTDGVPYSFSDLSSLLIFFFFFWTNFGMRLVCSLCLFGLNSFESKLFFPLALRGQKILSQISVWQKYSQSKFFWPIKTPSLWLSIPYTCQRSLRVSTNASFGIGVCGFRERTSVPELEWILFGTTLTKFLEGDLIVVT